MKPLHLLDRLADSLHTWHERHLVRDSLAGMSDRELADIGLTRDDIDAVATGTFEKDSERLH